jgi:hypothetical protein
MTENPENNFSMNPFSEKPKTIEEYKSQANPILQEHGQQIVKKSQYTLIKYGLWILAGIVIILAYAVINNSFKSEINIPSCPAPAEIPPCPSCPTNTCSPSLSCGNLTCPSLPSILQINLTNHS